MLPQEAVIIPPTDGSTLLPDTLAFHRRNNANIPVYLYMEDGAKDLAQVTYEQLDKACRRVVRSIGANTDPSIRPVVALIAQTDTLVYQTTVAGLMLAGYVPFPISPRNTAAAIVNLLKTTSCHYIVATCCTLKDLVYDIQRELEHLDVKHILTIKEAPTLFELFPHLSDAQVCQDSESELPCSYPTNCPTVNVDDVSLYLHSSGSTGYPKAIPKTHRNILEYVTSPCCAIFRNRNKRYRMPGMALPPFHALGIVVELFLPLFSCVSVVFFPPVVKSPELVPTLATPENVLHHVKSTKCNAMVIIPAFLQAWTNVPESIDTLCDLEIVIYSGAGLGTKIGNLLVESKISLKSVYGGTEVGGPAFSSQREGDEHEWEYVEFSDACNVRWVPHGDETYECQLLTIPTHHPSVCNLSDVEGFATSDLFKRHPHKDYLWKIVGRLDDVIVHTSGEKTVPLPMEGVMMSSPHIMSVVMFGHGHDWAGVLVEPTPSCAFDSTDAVQVAEFLDLIWPVIDEANQIAPAFSKIYREMVLFTDRQKPLPRAPKGTVIRKLALSAYEEEIKAIYTRIGSSNGDKLAKPLKMWDQPSVVEWLLCQVHDLCRGKDISNTDNLFEQGLDSLSAATLRRRIIGVIQTTAPGGTSQQIAHNIIYTYPSIEALANHLLGLTDGSDLVCSSVEAHERDIEDMIWKYEFPRATLSPRRLPSSATVLLTGSTGQLGSQILEGLLKDQRIIKVYTLNRRSAQQSIWKRHLERFRDQGLDEELLRSKRITHLESDTSEEKLGLSETTYCELRDCVTIIIHAAWKLDFNLPLSSFEAHVRGTHNLLVMARSMQYAAVVKFIFTSSVSTAQAWDRAVGLYPESLVLDAKSAVGMGYGESKYVAERIIASSGLNATALRIGQICGGNNGAWAASDWVPIVIKSSIALGSLPLANGSVSWLPMLAVKTCILDLVWNDGHCPSTLNVVHPRGVAWDAVMTDVRDALEYAGKPRLALEPFARWFSLLEHHDATSSDHNLENIPAIKLLDFLRRLCLGDELGASTVYTVGSKEGAGLQAFNSAEFATEKAETLSGALADLAPLDSHDVEQWVAYWCSCGFL